MEERRSYEQDNGGTGECDCRPFPDGHLRETASIRRLIKKLEAELLEGPPPDKGQPPRKYEPTEATKKFGEELKDFDKEYQGLAGIVSSYEKFFDNLDCLLAKARAQREQIDEGWKGQVDANARKAIADLREVYEAEEKRTGSCCKWIGYRDLLNKQGDCLARAARTEEEAKDDNEAFKGFEKTLTDRFKDFERLTGEADKLRKAEKFKSVYAVALEFADAYKKLDVVVTWEYQRNKCKDDDKEQQPNAVGQPQSYGGEQQSYTADQQSYGGGQSRPDGDEEAGHGEGGSEQGDDGEDEKKYRPKVMPPKEYKEALDKALRTLILSKYQRFRWHQKRLEIELKVKDFKDVCEKFRKSRQDEFIQEAEDAEAAPSGATSKAAAV